MFKFLRRFLKPEEDVQERLARKFAHFRQILESNNQALAVMADMEEKAGGEFLFDTGYLQQQVGLLEKHLTTMVTEINALTDQAYPELVRRHQEIIQAIRRELSPTWEIPDSPFVLPLKSLNRESAPAVGGKMAALGEIAAKLGLAVPPGFAISTRAYLHFLSASGLAGKLSALLAQASITDLESLEDISRQAQDLVRQTPLPPDLEEALGQASHSLAARHLAVRSSAVGEDARFSFAGQFLTLLNVPNTPENLVRAYKEIVASKFRPRAIFYWKYRQFALEELPMAVGVLAMVDARASGVMFSQDPHHPEANAVLITAVWGLGKYAVDGTITPDLYRVARDRGHQVLEARVAEKPVALVSREDEGCVEVTLPQDQAHSPCLTAEYLGELTEVALKLEKHFGGPQDIEWALDFNNRLIILQSRPLQLGAPAFGAQPRETLWEPAPPLLNFGIRASGGVAAGPVFILQSEREVGQIPPGAVVVARQPSARLVLAMDRVAAIITEVGNPTDHMSILAREFKVPALVDVGGATRVLRPGQMVTVDADAARVYPGVVLELLERRTGTEPTWKDNPVYHMLDAILKKTVPLNLYDPESPEFRAENCRTLHDLTRFIHEKAMDAMFFLDVEEAVEARGVCRLKTDLPLNLFVLDLGGGLRVKGQSIITEEDIVSRPFRALLRGFHHPRVRWAGSVAPDLKGFISVWANTMYDMAKGERGLGGKSFAIITDRYLNFNSRLGYHFGFCDAYLSEERNDNYISFQFKGGAASVDRRERRARLLGQILEGLGFKVQIKGDLVQGRMAKYSLLETEETLEMTALLMAFCRQLDLALTSDAMLDRVLQAFRREDYGLACLRPEEAAS
jgi:pyruvate,water dikinase